VDDFEFLEKGRGRALFRSVAHRLFVRHDYPGRAELDDTFTDQFEVVVIAGAIAPSTAHAVFGGERSAPVQALSRYWASTTMR
jgi:hypothetical protein